MLCGNAEIHFLEDPGFPATSSIIPNTCSAYVIYDTSLVLILKLNYQSLLFFSFYNLYFYVVIFYLVS